MTITPLSCPTRFEIYGPKKLIMDSGR